MAAIGSAVRRGQYGEQVRELAATDEATVPPLSGDGHDEHLHLDHGQHHQTQGQATLESSSGKEHLAIYILVLYCKTLARRR